MNSNFIEQNMGLVHLCARKFMGRGTDYEDLVQIASIGLIKATANFDESRGLKFSTYAVPVIIGEIKGFLRSDGIIKISRRLKELSTKINMIIEKSVKENCTPPSISQIAIMLEESEELIAQAMCSSSCMVSLTMKNEDGENQLEIPIPSEEEEITDKLSLRQIIKTLPDKDKELITLRYFKNKTQTEVAKSLGCSQVQISRREKKILLELRQQLS